jgi:hypothetical protein
MQLKTLFYVAALVLSCAPVLTRADEAEPSVLGLKLGMRIAEVQSALDRMKSDFPHREIYTAPDPAGGPAYTTGIEGRTSNGARRLYVQFSPPFDGQKVVAIERKVLYSVPGQSAPAEFEAAPKVRLTMRALLERYGPDPLILFPMGELLLWPLDTPVLTDDDILKRCVYANERVGTNPINGTRGCGRTMQALIEPNFVHPTLVGSMRIDLVDQDRILELQSAGQEVEIKNQEKQRAKQGSGGKGPSL